MKTNTTWLSIVLLALTAMAWSSVQAVSDHGHDQAVDLKAVHQKVLPMSQKSLAAAVAAVKAGNQETALKELAHLQAMLTQVEKSIVHAIGPIFANDKCPIMGAPIQPKRVTPDLIRDYQGQKIAFCCAGCPEAWDKMNDNKKQAKLQAAKPAPKKHDHAHH